MVPTEFPTKPWFQWGLQYSGGSNSFVIVVGMNFLMKALSPDQKWSKYHVWTPKDWLSTCIEPSISKEITAEKKKTTSL